MFNGCKIFNSYVSLPEGNYLPPFTSGIFQLARFDDTWGILRLISQVFYHNIPMNNLSIIHEEPTVSHLSLPTIYSINNPWKIPVKWQDKSGCIMLYHVISCYIMLYQPTLSSCVKDEHPRDWTLGPSWSNFGAQLSRSQERLADQGATWHGLDWMIWMIWMRTGVPKYDFGNQKPSGNLTVCHGSHGPCIDDFSS